MQATARRNIELSLLILALIVGAGAMALVALARDSEDVIEIAPYLVVTGRRLTSPLTSRCESSPSKVIT